MRRRAGLVLAAVALAGGGAGCGTDDEEPPVGPSVPPAERDAAIRAAHAYLRNRDPKRCAALATPSGESYCRRYARASDVTPPDPRIASVEISRENATIGFTASGRGRGSILLRKVNESWRGEAVVGRDYQPPG